MPWRRKHRRASCSIYMTCVFFVFFSLPLRFLAKICFFSRFVIGALPLFLFVCVLPCFCCVWCLVDFYCGRGKGMRGVLLWVRRVTGYGVLFSFSRMDEPVFLFGPLYTCGRDLFGGRLYRRFLVWVRFSFFPLCFLAKKDLLL